jgi:hypothetical protein
MRRGNSSTPLEDQKPSHRCISAVCLHLVVATCQGEQIAWPCDKLFSQQYLTQVQSKELAASHYQGQGSASKGNPVKKKEAASR